MSTNFRYYHQSLIPMKMRTRLQKDKVTPNAGLNKKIRRQKKCAQQIIDMGYTFDGHLSEAKTMLNRILLNDAKLFNLIDIGNGNVRNLKDRLIPRLMDECKKKNLSQDGSYVDLRNRLVANTTIFGKDILSKIKVENLKGVKSIVPGANTTYFDRVFFEEYEEKRQKFFAEKLKELGVNYEGHFEGARNVLIEFMKKDAEKLGIKEIGNGNIRDLNGRLHAYLIKECRKRNIQLKKPNYIQMRNALLPTGMFKDLVI